jgi:hypothetical protein
MASPIDPTLTLVSGAAGAFFAAWAGAFLGFRRTRRERGLDRLVAWQEAAIQGLAQYEATLMRLTSVSLNELVIKRPGGAAPPEMIADGAKIDEWIRAPSALWAELRECEGRVRAALRLADLFVDTKTAVACDLALRDTTNVFVGNWCDVSAEPLIPWTDLAKKALASESLRRGIQTSLTVVLEFDGAVSNLLGARFRNWRTLREIRRLQAELGEPAS